MRDYLRILGILFRKTGMHYPIYLLLCLFEVLRNAAVLLSVYWGVHFFVVGAEGTVRLLALGVLGAVACELAVIAINYFMNKTEERLEQMIYRDLIGRSAHLPLATLENQAFRLLFRDVLEVGMPALTTLAVDLSAYLQFGCNILIYTLVASRAGVAFVATSLVSMGLAHFFVSRAERGVKVQRLAQSKCRNRRRYFVDLFDQEKHHAEIVGNEAGDYFAERSEQAHHAFLEANAEIKHHQLRSQLLASLVIGAGALLSLVLLFLRSSNGMLSLEEFLVIVVAEVLLYQEMQVFVRILGWDKEALHFGRKYLAFLECTEKRGVSVDAGTAGATEAAGFGSMTFQAASAGTDTNADTGAEGDSEVETDTNAGTTANTDTATDTGECLREIRLDGVGLCYGETRAVDGVSFTLRRGKRYLLIGDNGAGKSSLLGMLCGLYTPTEGAVRNERGEALCPEILKRRTAYVSQSFPMLALSVRESFFSPGTNDEAIWWALEQVGLREKIEDSPRGLGSVVGKEVFFSKGQWQRLIVARLLVHRERDIWILDEPTSAMDALWEEQLLRTVFEAGKEKIVVVVSHRLGMAAEMDGIIRMERGTIVSAGTHTTLMERDAKYREAYLAQRQMYDVNGGDHWSG